VAALVVLAVLVGVVVARKSGQPKDDKPKEATLVFTTQEVVQPQSMALPGKVTFSGPLVAPSTVTVRAKAAGTLVSLRVDEGSRVTGGVAGRHRSGGAQCAPEREDGPGGGRQGPAGPGPAQP
jgi:multidrug efflux pump subunit AcrA (membrane-fusion protein)